MEQLPGPALRKLKSLAQKLEPMVTLGKARVSEGFIASLNEALENHELVKVKFGEYKDEKKELAREVAEKTQSQIIMQVGHVVVLYRQQPDTEKRKIQLN